MDVYSHIIEGMQRDAMALRNEVLPSGKNDMSKIKRQFNAKGRPIID